MTWLLDLRDAHPVTLPQTFRERYGVSAFEMGSSLPWREAFTLAQAAVQDLSTALGAEHAGWDYPASTWEIMMLMTQLPDNDEVRARALPFRLNPDTPIEELAEESAQELELIAAQARDEMMRAFQFAQQ